MSAGIITRYSYWRGQKPPEVQLLDLLLPPATNFILYEALVLHLVIQDGVLFLEYELTHADTLAETCLP